MKKTLRAITILHICTINDNYMMYGSSDVEHDRHNFLSFVATFCPFNSLTPTKTKLKKIKKKKKKKNICRELLSFYKCIP